MELTEEQRKRAEANRLAALAKRKAFLESSAQLQSHQNKQNPWLLFKCRKLSHELNPRPHNLANEQPSIDSVEPLPRKSLVEKFQVRLEICSPDAFSATPLALRGFPYPGEERCLQKLSDCLSNVMPSHYTQNHGGAKACVYKLGDYHDVLKCLKASADIEVEDIPWGTFNVIERLSHSFVAGRWMPCRPEHLPDDKVDELIEKIPRRLLDALLPFQVDGLRFGLRRGGRCLIADEMGLGKTLQAIAIAGCFMNEGSILVVCPAVLRFTWAEELERWLPHCLPADIHLVFGHQDNPSYLTRCPRVVVISYTMLHRLRTSMLERDWALLIVDESHHVRCAKKATEPGEIKAVLDIAAKVKRIILLSGTPSLSRPYDIFHQINILWPSLLGMSKYEFAKTYCDFKRVKGIQGKYFMDVSKGNRLEELNVLLKQTVMIRRLKQHVLQQLPPKRRQIIRLLLKRSDIVAAKTAVGVLNNDSSIRASDDKTAVGVLNDDTPKSKAKTTVEVQNGDHSESATEAKGEVGVLNDDTAKCGVNEDTAWENFDEPDGKLSYQELGIAKLSGFREWLSIHPLIAAPDSSSKMIIFAHHLKVLDGVQEFICEKGIGFVRIDGSTLARDRQSAVVSFRSSPEVKVAIIGILAAGFGVDFSTAQNVVFLELPQCPMQMLQAEDRAHRRGQSNAVNVYIFCAKDTMDDSHWKNLNKSLHRVSSTTDGKYDAMQEIKVEGISYLETSVKTDNGFEDRPTANASSEASDLTVMVPDIGSVLDLQPSQVNPAGSVAAVTQDMNSSPKTKADDNPPVQSIEAEESSFSQVDFLRFEVSPYTGRIHLYTCVLGTDTRPRPLYENFRPEELELLSSLAEDDKKNMHFSSLKDNPAYRHALVEFTNEWKKLRPIERKKLLGKPLQLPLAVELCYMSESINHNNMGLLNGGSKRRMTPLMEISHPLPSGAVWRKIYLRRGHGKREKEYTQGWTEADEPLCKLCQNHCMANNAKTPEYFEDLFCNLVCYEEYRMRTSNRFLRHELFQIEGGVCSNCQLDCHKLVEHIRPLSLARRREYIEKVAPQIAKRKNMLEKLVNDPTEGNAWHADHIVPVYQGGGECRLENMRTLCVACHYDVTTAQAAERRRERAKAKKQLKAIMNDLKTGHMMDASSLKDVEGQGNVVEEELIVQVPGSAYSIATTQSVALQSGEDRP